MSTSQDKIEAEQTKVHILKLMIQFGENEWDSDSVAYCQMVTVRKAEKMLSQLLDDELIFKFKSGYKISSLGRDYIKDIAVNVSIVNASEVTKYKEEALSGLVEKKSNKSGYLVSEKSKLTRAVLPSIQKHHNTKDPEMIFGAKDREKKGLIAIANHLELTVEKVEELNKEGRVRMCKKCGNVGVFHLNGKSFKNACQKCRKNNYIASKCE